MRGKPVLALAFVAIMAVVLSIPLRGTSDDGPRETRQPDAGTTTSPKDEATPEDEPTPDEETSPDQPPEEDEPVGDTIRFSGNYPNRCLEPAPDPADTGLVAIDQGDAIEVGDITGSDPVVVEDQFPLKWSPTGTYFVAGSGTVYDRQGVEVASLFDDDAALNWAWSPIADCAVTASDEGMSVFVPGSEPKALHDGSIARFSFSPGGGDLAYVEVGDDEQAHLWVASLATGKATRLTTLDVSPSEEVVLAGWTPDARHVLFWRGAPEDLLRTGGSLFAVSARGKVTSLATVLAHRDFLTSCGENLVAVVGGGARTETHPKQVAIVNVGARPQVLTPKGAHDLSPSCSPDGSSIALVRTGDANGEGPGTLTVIDPTGAEIFSPDNTGYKDAYPMWGRGDAGVLFVRQPLEGGDPELWRVVEGGSPTPTGITLRGIDRKPGVFRDAWGHWLDWSADQPSGVGVLIEGDS